MPSIPRPYDVVAGIRDSAESQRWQGVQQAVRGSIVARSITAEMIQVGAITGDEIADGSIGGGEVANGAITGVKIAGNTITAGNIQAGAITASELAANSVTASKINVTSLSAITADLGTIHTGSIEGATIKLGSATPYVYGSSTGIRAVGDQASYRFFYEDDSTRVGAARCNTPIVAGGHVVQVELDAYLGLSETSGNCTAAIRVRDNSGDDEQGFVKVSGNGNVSGSSGYTNSSDRRLKKRIADVKDPLDAIAALRPRTFVRRRSGLPDAGFVAQELQEVLPDLVHEAIDEAGNAGISYDGLHAYTVGAIQELAGRLERLEKR